MVEIPSGEVVQIFNRSHRMTLDPEKPSSRLGKVTPVESYGHDLGLV
jgi:hypothetical protein